MEWSCWSCQGTDVTKKEKRKMQPERKKTLPDEEIGKYLAKMPKQEGMN